MNTQYVALNQQKHANTRVATGPTYDGIDKHHLIPIAVTEFERASSSLPIVFVKNTESGQFESVVVLGIEKGENLFFEQGQWQSEFVPQVIQRHPFALTPDKENEQQLLVAIDENSRLVGTTDGELLFDENGSETAFLENRKRELQNYHEACMYGQVFIQRLVSFGVMEVTNITLNAAGKKTEIAGVYIVNHEKLNQLSDDKFLELRKLGDLPAIYAHLSSLKQFNRLAKLKN
jgi:hypothetical protein